MLAGPFHRREILRLGALSLFSASAAGSSLARDASADVAEAEGKSAKSCIYLFLQGGPSHIDLWDPKPKAAAEIRGPFRPIETNVPGIQLGELMVRTAAIADRLAIIRSMTHEFNNHIAGTYIMQTGSVIQANIDREAAGDDFPGPGAILNWLQTQPSSVPVSVSLPNWLSIPGPSNRMPGQYAGVLGAAYDPFLIQGNPHQADFKPLSLTLPGEVSNRRFESRLSLLQQLDATARQLENKVTLNYDRMYQAAFELLIDPRVREAVDLSRESAEVRDRYGRDKLGQSLLLARRLIEAGVRFVSVNEFNQSWDHHWAVESTLKNRVPPMESSFATLIEDLVQRGLLDSTLVIHTGEFGRSPVINPEGGRDHWPNVYTTVMAGGGVRGGQVYGSSDANGGEVQTGPVTPADFLATMWALLGIDPRREMRDRFGRPVQLSNGRIIESLIG